MSRRIREWTREQFNTIEALSLVRGNVEITSGLVGRAKKLVLYIRTEDGFTAEVSEDGELTVTA